MLKDIDDKILLADGFEEALLGYATQGNRTMAVYDREKCIQILMDRNGVTSEEAEDYFQYNTEGAWMGEYTPAFLTRLE
jgi:hypothetical protein